MMTITTSNSTREKAGRHFRFEGGRVFVGGSRRAKKPPRHEDTENRAVSLCRRGAWCMASPSDYLRNGSTGGNIRAPPLSPNPHSPDNPTPPPPFFFPFT